MPQRKLKFVKEYKIIGEAEVKEVTKYGTGAHIVFLKQHIGKEVVVGIINRK